MAWAMKLIMLLVALLGLWLPGSFGQEDAPGNGEEAAAPEINEEKVVVLTNDNFDSVTKENKNTLVEFYAPWCGHCQSLAPEYAKAALRLAETHPSVVLAKVDATEESELAERFGVDGFPTLKWITPEGEVDYNGGRTEDAIVKWVTKMTGPATKVITTVEELKKAEAEADAIVVGYFAADTAENDTALTEFIKTARMDVNDIFYQTSVSAVAEAAGAALGSFSVISTFKPEGVRKTVQYSGELTDADMEEFVRFEVIPTVVPFSADTSEIIFGSGIDNHLIFVAPAATLNLSEASFKAFHTVAQKMRPDRSFVFVTVDGDSNDAEPVMQFFELEGSDLPVLIGFEMEPGQRKYPFNGTLTVEDIEAFANGIIDGSIKPDLKSDDVPEDDKDGHVQIVVGQTVEDIVFDSTKDVLLEVYAPWCSHCQALEPAYKKLAARFKDIDSVVIAKMDGTTNEHPDIEVDGFPSIIFLPASEEVEIVEFDGERTLKALTKFIKEHAVIPYELKKKSDMDGSDGDEAAEETTEEVSDPADAPEPSDAKDEL